MTSIPQYSRGEWTFISAADYDDPFQEAELQALFHAPSGREHRVYGFWDGGTTWRLRFTPDEKGEWSYNTVCSDEHNSGLHDQRGEFRSGDPQGDTVFSKHGPVRLSKNRHHFVHTDGTPFFWLADTAWNGPLLSEEEEWRHYLKERVRQGFTGVMWVATQWLAAPQGDREGRRAFEGHERISLDLDFFRRLEGKHDAIINVGLLSVPVLLWTAVWNRPEDSPGNVLPEDQAVRLARYMVARWGADPVAWCLPGDGDYQGEHAERWRRIGRAVFSNISHAPVTLHPNAQQWIGNFKNEPWLDFIGYQSGHGDSDEWNAWLLSGPPAKGWRDEPSHPVVNLEPPYENHLAYHSKEPFDAHKVRRALYWSLLNAPTAGVTYGGHGVWGWDDGSAPPTAHPNTGTPLPWREALNMPAAEEVKHLYELFTSIQWWTLLPAPELLAEQPGEGNTSRFVTASRSAKGGVAVLYLPTETPVRVAAAYLTQYVGDKLDSRWFNPRNGDYSRAESRAEARDQLFSPPEGGDWVLLLQSSSS